MRLRQSSKMHAKLKLEILKPLHYPVSKRTITAVTSLLQLYPKTIRGELSVRPDEGVLCDKLMGHKKYAHTIGKTRAGQTLYQ